MEQEKTVGGRSDDRLPEQLDGVPESEAVWEQLLRLAESGDIRAIKLYYEMLERKRRIRENRERTVLHRNIEELCEIRRAVFGDAAIREDLLASEEWIRTVMLDDPADGNGDRVQDGEDTLFAEEDTQGDYAADDI